MAYEQRIEGPRIGETLKAARRKAGMDMRDVEDRTKIRIRYLRALEAEDWDALPGPAYARGFLRTYAELVGLDPDSIIDEYRRQVEEVERPGARFGLGEGVRERRRGPGPPTASPGWIGAVAVAVALVAAAGILLLTGDGDGPGDRDGGGARDGRPASERPGAGGGTGPDRPAPRTGPIRVAIRFVDSVGVCLVTGGGEPLIDGQTLAAGTEEGPFEADGFRLDLSGGAAVDLRIDDRARKLRPQAQATYLISARGIDRRPYRGPGCP